jgi:hypothetical protein
MELQLRHLFRRDLYAKYRPYNRCRRKFRQSFLMYMLQAQEQFSNTREDFEQQVHFQTGTQRAEACGLTGGKVDEIGDIFQNIVG